MPLNYYATTLKILREAATAPDNNQLALQILRLSRYDWLFDEQRRQLFSELLSMISQGLIADQDV